jgi:tetratricopeptide (TPR) repeat protein
MSALSGFFTRKYWMPFRVLAACGLILGGAVLIPSADASVVSEFNKANRLYEEAQYREAAAVYQQLIQSSNHSPALYFNLGNAYLKSGQIGWARACYWLAREKAPRDQDIRSNCRLLQQQAGPEPATWWHRFLQPSRWLSLNEWTLLVSGFGWIILSILALTQWLPKAKLRCRRWLQISIVAGTIACVGLLMSLYDRYGISRGVIIVAKAEVKRGPIEESQVFYTLANGAMVSVTDRQFDWWQVTDPNGRTGWLPEKQLVLVRPGRISLPWPK